MKGMPKAVNMERMDPSMSMDTANCKDIGDYDVGEEGEIKAKYKITSKDMIDEKDPKKGYRCRMTLSNIEISDEVGKDAEHWGVSRQKMKEIKKKNEKGGE